MAITQAMSTSFKVEILDGYHNFGTGPVRATSSADSFYMALVTSAATLDASTTNYSALGANEVANGSGYTTGGNLLVITTTPTSSGTTAYLSFQTSTWTAATFSTAGALIYNQTQGGKAVAVLSFGSTITLSGGTLNIYFPTAAAGTAIIQIA